MKTFNLNDTVHWVSRGGATQKLKEGVVERVVPANQRIPAELAKEADAYGLARDHVSFMVRVGKTATRKGKLYWPQTKDLREGPAPQ